MSLLQTKLKTLVGQEIVVVMVDNRAFRGTLMEFDAEDIVLRNVVEAAPNNASGWEETTSSTGIVHKVVTWQGVFSHENTAADIVKLKDVMIRTSGVLLLVGIVAALALAVRGLLFRVRGAGRGGRFT